MSSYTVYGASPSTDLLRVNVFSYGEVITENERFTYVQK